MAKRSILRYWNPVVLLTCLVLCAIVGYLAGYYDLDLRSWVPWFTPILAWLTVSKEMRQYFRLAWFWWASSLFIIGSGLTVSISILARANVLLWMLILVVEAAAFAGLVEYISSRLYGGLDDE